jgi:hypothetical protein
MLPVCSWALLISKSYIIDERADLGTIESWQEVVDLLLVVRIRERLTSTVLKKVSVFPQDVELVVHADSL